MFYSHTFLARKGPLGTVWCAAHLQHKLRKSHYIGTNVSSTVEKIMNPEVPIALRMSGHLLLGVVRIYSKQVDYFFEDCNEIRNTINRVFTVVSVNLPSEATQAPVHSITLPEKFDLDKMELDVSNMDWCEDSHLTSRDEITLTDQIPTGNDPYIVISFDEHELRASSLMEATSVSGPTPMDEEDRADIVLDASATGFKSPSPNNVLGADGNRSPQNVPSIEIMREAQPGFDFNNSPILPDRAAPDKFLEDQINRDEEMHTPLKEGVVLPDADFSSSHRHEEQPPSFGRLDSDIPFEHRSPEMEIQPTPEMQIQPTPPVAKPKVKRKRKQPFDTDTVLINDCIKDNLADTSDILREKGNCPLTSLAIWKQNNKIRLRKGCFIVEPHITGASADLLSLYMEDSTKNHLVITQETHQETNVGQPSLSRHDSNIEIEVLRHNERASPDGRAPFLSTPVPSTSRTNQHTPEKSNLSLQSDRLDRTDGDGTLPRSDVGASGNLDSEIRTPDAFYENDMQFDNTGLSDIPELVPSAGDLGFLDQDDVSPPGSQGTPGIGISPVNQTIPVSHQLSSRTRAVAQYLKRQTATPISPNAEESSEELSLGKILDGKPRKICARMFFEMLVLKSCELVDVHQEEPYDDIVLKVTPKLSKDQFSS